MLAVACVTGAPAGVTCGAVRPAVLRPLGPYLYGSKAVAIFPATTTRCAVKRRRHALRRQAGMRSNAASTSDSQGGTAHELSEGSAPGELVRLPRRIVVALESCAAYGPASETELGHNQVMLLRRGCLPRIPCSVISVLACRF